MAVPLALAFVLLHLGARTLFATAVLALAAPLALGSADTPALVVALAFAVGFAVG